jgi:hypothetical protein
MIKTDFYDGRWTPTIFVDFLDPTMMYPRANIIEKTGNHIIIFVVDVVDGLLYSCKDAQGWETCLDIVLLQLTLQSV